MHPDEVSLKERQSTRQWCIENIHIKEPPLDAELDLLSNEELALHSSEKARRLATILNDVQEMKRRIKLNCRCSGWVQRDRLLDEELDEDFSRYFNDIYLVSSSVRMLQATMSPISSIGAVGLNLQDSSDGYSALHPGLDTLFNGDLSETVQELNIFQEPDTTLTKDCTGPKMPLHPVFNRLRDSVDFHEHMYEDTWT